MEGTNGTNGTNGENGVVGPPVPLDRRDRQAHPVHVGQHGEHGQKGPRGERGVIGPPGRRCSRRERGERCPRTRRADRCTRSRVDYPDRVVQQGRAGSGWVGVSAWLRGPDREPALGLPAGHGQRLHLRHSASVKHDWWVILVGAALGLVAAVTAVTLIFVWRF